MKISNLAVVGAVALSLAGCASGSREAGGTVIGAGTGALAGGLIGGAVGGTGGTIVGAVTGAALGGVVGNAIGRDLDQRDQEAAYDAQAAAWESGQRKPWRGARAYGYVEPGTEYVDSRGTCRNYTHRIYIDGRPQSAQGVACRGPDGVWRPV
ncbi:MAG: glycine zipper domain-containing protein [Beijerinckiaceae bacterium]